MRFNGFIALAAAASQSAALGINCHGDTLCGIAYMSGGRLSQFQTIFDNIFDKRIYDNGDDVGCIEVDSVNFSGTLKSTFCAYIQNSGDSVSGATLKNLYTELAEYGCAICGSIPLLYAKGDNDSNHGELSFNMVDSLPDNCELNKPCSTS
jgi:hypothetical protein